MIDDTLKTAGNYHEELERTAGLWSVYLGDAIDAHDVACMMALLKVSQTQAGSVKPADYADGAAYLAMAGELLGRDSG